jgi:MFS family permease
MKNNMVKKSKSIYSLNKIIKYLLLSDLIFFSGWGLISPLFAIFLLNSIVGGTAFVVGLAAGVSLIVRSVLRIPFGVLADRGQKIAYSLMFWGLLISSVIPLGYIYSKTAIHIYILQAMLGMGLAMSTAGWTCLFARHIDKGKESTEFGYDAVAVGVGPGIAGIIGGAALTYFSFNAVFIAVTLFGLLGVFLLLFIKKDILKGDNLIFKNNSSANFYELRRLKKARV